MLSAIDLYTAFSHANDPRLARTPRGYRGRRARSMTQRRIARTGYAAAFVLLVAGMLCLLADLGRPEAFYLLFLYPTGSFVSVGHVRSHAVRGLSSSWRSLNPCSRWALRGRGPRSSRKRSGRCWPSS